MRLEVDQFKARALGVTSQAIAQATRAMVSGTNVGQYRKGNRLTDIVLPQSLDECNASRRSAGNEPLVAQCFLGADGGLVVATALTLLALPAMYAAWFRVKREQ